MNETDRTNATYGTKAGITNKSHPSHKSQLPPSPNALALEWAKSDIDVTASLSISAEGGSRFPLGLTQRDLQLQATKSTLEMMALRPTRRSSYRTSLAIDERILPVFDRQGHEW